MRVREVVKDLPRDAQALSSSQQYRTLLGVSEVIVSHRDLRGLFHDLADRLHQVVRFDYLILVLHDAASDTMRRHVLAASGIPSHHPVMAFPVDQAPAGLVWQTQQPLVISNLEEE